MKAQLEYTPLNIAKDLVAGARNDGPRTVADFCAGEGSLLSAAAEIWPRAKLFAADINRDVYSALPSAEWVCADFLSPDFERQVDRAFEKKFDLILLNPPFAFQCSRPIQARGAYHDQSCSVAFAFLFTALEYLEDDGELLAIMPTSSLRSERDAASRQALRRGHNCTIIAEPSYDRFPGLDVSTYLMRVTRKKGVSTWSELKKSETDQHRSFTIMRGKVSVKRSERVVQSGLHSWIHTTSIRSSKVQERYELPEGTAVGQHCFLRKGAIVVPRVGKVRPSQIAVTTRREVLSDCLFGITLEDVNHSRVLMEFFKRDFRNFLDLYAGTGAPYTTQQKLARYIDGALLQVPEAHNGRQRDRC